MEEWSLTPGMIARLCFSMLFITGLLISPSIGQASADGKAALRPLRVVTYNLLHDGPGSGFLTGDTRLEERLEMVIRELQGLDPDIVAVQEASESRRHGHVPDRLASALGFQVVFAPATEHLFGIRPLDRLVVGLLGFKEGSAILSRFPIVASQVYELPRCTSWIDRRILLRAELSTPWGPLQMFSTHTARGDDCQVDRVGDILRDRRDAGPSVLAGDFNMPDTSKELARLRDDGGFVDVFRRANPTAEGPTVYQRIHAFEPTVSRRVDFIWLLNGEKSSVAVRSSRIVLNRPKPLPDGSALWPSDHYGVLVDLDIPPLPSAEAAMP
jgi:endonuclease/exonuclease/phosphatase family metal-dependent hydrolase